MAHRDWSRIARTQDFLGGALLVLIGAGGLLAGLAYDIGTSARMGPGYLPRILCIGLAGVGLAIALQGLGRGAPSLLRPQARGLLLVPLSLMAFAGLVGSFGLSIAMPALLLIAAAAWRDFRPGEAIVLAVGLTVACIVLFAYLLGLPIPVFPNG